MAFLFLGAGFIYADEHGDDDDNHVDRSKLVAMVKVLAPADMVAQSNRDPQTTPLAVDATTGNLDGGALPVHVVAAYANGVNGRIRLFKVDSTGLKLMADSSVPGMAGLVPHVDLLDIDADKKPEVVVRFTNGGGRSGVWVLKWNGTQLSSITPVIVTSGVPVSLLTDAVFEDVDGTGKLVAVTGADPGSQLGDQSRDGVMRSRTYKFTNGRFVQSSDLFYARRVYGAESPLTMSFVVGRLDVQYRLRLSNGDAFGKNAVKSGEIAVNDATLFSKGDFDRGARVLTATFQPRETNVIRVDIHGSKRGTLFLTVEPVAPLVDKALIPSVDCVWDDGDGRFTARFAYENRNPWFIAVEMGPRNAFNGDRIGRGQSTTFFPGKSGEAFWVQSNGEPLAWTLDGTIATATLDVPRCTAPEPVRRVF